MNNVMSIFRVVWQAADMIVQKQLRDVRAKGGFGTIKFVFVLLLEQQHDVTADEWRYIV